MKLTSYSKDELTYIKNLYNAAFPKAEKKPFFLLERREKKGTVDILLIKDDKPLGLVITAIYNDLVLIDYFAIDSTLRGKGVGSEAIRLISEKYKGKRIFLEIERLDENAQNNDQRIKRKSFYLKNGLTETGVFSNAFGVEMEILSFGSKITFEDYHNTYKNVFGYLPSLKIKKIS